MGDTMDNLGQSQSTAEQVLDGIAEIIRSNRGRGARKVAYDILEYLVDIKSDDGEV